MATTKKHKVFVSYDHDDEIYKEKFCKLLKPDIVDKSVEDGAIDPNLKVDTVRQMIRDEFIADATVTVVLVGECTWQRKHVDWEIGSSLRATKNNPRCGLLGILLPTHYNFEKDTYRRGRLIPPRLADNCSKKHPFGTIHGWPEPWNAKPVREWIHEAFQQRHKVNPNNTRLQFKRNRQGSCRKGWTGPISSRKSSPC